MNNISLNLHMPAAHGRPRVVGILNVTNDSFSDGGQFHDIENAFAQANKMVNDGADIIDIGGESTRPGAQAVSVQQELDRVIPIVERVAGNLDTIISVDTSKAEVMHEAVKSGASIINDVCALQLENALETISKLDVSVCIMHMQGTPRTMQKNPVYDHVVDDIISFLQQRINLCLQSGMSIHQLMVDPGFGFGKTVQHNLTLLSRLTQFKKLKVPVWAGLSRKSMIEKITGLGVDKRMPASVALAIMAVERGAQFVRVHDVIDTVAAIKLWYAMYMVE